MIGRSHCDDTHVTPATRTMGIPLRGQKKVTQLFISRTPPPALLASHKLAPGLG
jgi:hypothetical protein